MQAITPEEHQAWLLSAPTQKILAELRTMSQQEFQRFLSAGPTATEEYLRDVQRRASAIADLIKLINKHHA